MAIYCNLLQSIAIYFNLFAIYRQLRTCAVGVEGAERAPGRHVSRRGQVQEAPLARGARCCCFFSCWGGGGGAAAATPVAAAATVAFDHATAAATADAAAVAAAAVVAAPAAAAPCGEKSLQEPVLPDGQQGQGPHGQRVDWGQIGEEGDERWGWG
jgi:hypothetical protein